MAGRCCRGRLPRTGMVLSCGYCLENGVAADAKDNDGQTPLRGPP